MVSVFQFSVKRESEGTTSARGILQGAGYGPSGMIFQRRSEVEASARRAYQQEVKSRAHRLESACVFV